MDELEQVQQAIQSLEAQRSVLSDAVVDLALAPLKEKLLEIQKIKQPEQQIKLATILFLDIANYTAQTRHLDPEELMEYIDEIIARLAAPVEEYNGRIVRYQGDGFKAVFGVPIVRENDAENAVQAGLTMQRIAQKIGHELGRDQGADKFSVRVGIATGLVMAGGGVEGEYAVMGEPVNLAARLENLAQPGSVVISHQTYRQVREIFELQPLGQISLKGFVHPVPVYQVEKVKPPSFRSNRRGVEGVETRMVGREDEYERLKSLSSAVKNPGLPEFVMIIGEAGLGKSRLLFEFENWIETQPQKFSVFRSRARIETQRKPYGLLHDLLTNQFGIFDSDTEASAKEKLEKGVVEIAGSDHREWASFIGHLIGFDFSGSPELKGIREDSQQIREQAFHATSHLILETARAGQTLILLEDIHLADDGSLDFFEYLSQHHVDARLLVLCAARNSLFERRPDWGKGEPGWKRLDLAPLSEAEIIVLVNDILRKAIEIPPALQELLVRQSEGNPFYVEEVIKMLVDDGVIEVGPERWQIHTDKFVAVKIPQTLAGVIQARLDSLPVYERRVLDRASVIGRVFWDEPITHMQETNDKGSRESADDVNRELKNLQSRELVFIREKSSFSNTYEYIFKNAALRDVAYERMLKRVRRIYHEQAGQWLQISSGDRASEFAGRIAEHYDLAGQKEPAAEWYIRAANQAKETYAPETAKEYYQRAIELLDHTQADSSNQHNKIVEAQQGLSQVLVWLGQYLEAIEGYQRIIKEAEKSNEVRLQSMAWHGIAEAQMHRGDIRVALESAEQEFVLAESVGAEMEITKALWMKSWGAFRLGEMERAVPLAEEVAARSSRLQEPALVAHSLNLLGVIKSTIGNYPEASNHFEMALAIFRKEGNRVRAMPLMNNLGVIAEARGDYQKALRYYQEALDTARQIGNKDGEMVYLSNLGGVKVHLEDYHGAEADLINVANMAGSSGQDVLSSTFSFLGRAKLGSGKVQEAISNVQYALRLAEEMEAPDDLGLAWRALGQIAAALEMPVQPRESSGITFGAEECFAESERIFREIEREDELARTLRDWASYHLSRGNDDLGIPFWQESKRIFAELGADLEVKRMEEYRA
jgi:class 3 adenylate cyclase/tetratricopeptide (TPR) repeat protein